MRPTVLYSPKFAGRKQPPAPVVGHRLAPVASLSEGSVRLWRTEALNMQQSALSNFPSSISPADSAKQTSTITPPVRTAGVIPQHSSQFSCCLCNSPALANLTSPSNSMASCVMSSSSAVAAGAPRKAQAQANVLLSSRRASTISGVALPALARSTICTEAKRSLKIVASKATRETSVNEAEASVNEAGERASAAAEDFYKNLKASWDKSDDKPAIAGLGFAGLIGIWAAFGLIGAIEKLPLIPNLFEIVGILFTGWFVYRYLLFKPDREELLKVIDDAKARITGQ